MVIKVNLIDKLHTDLSNYLLSKRLIPGGTCGFSYREEPSCISQVIPLHSCKKDMSSHLQSCKFSDPENEVDLIRSYSSSRR